MVVVKKKFTIPEYREKKEIYEALGFKEKKVTEKGLYAYVFFKLNEKDPHYTELRKLEKDIYRKGPPFFPIILFVVAAFVFLSTFVIILAQSLKTDKNFDLLTNALSYLLPAFIFLGASAVYSYFYFMINKKIIEKGTTTKEEIMQIINKIKEK